MSNARYLTETLLTSNMISPPLPKSPHCPLLHISMKALSTTTTTAVLKKVLHRRALLHHVATSSRAKSTPPTGERKAAQTPEEAPQVMRSRRSRSLLKYRSHRHLIRWLSGPPCPSKEAMQLPMCTRGPSFPRSRPAETAPMLPIIYNNDNAVCHLS